MPPLTPPPATPSVLKWIVVQTAPGREFLVRDRLAELGVEGLFLPVLGSNSPFHRARDSAKSSGGGAVRSPLLFNRYVFVQLALPNKDVLERIQKLEGVRRVLGKSPADPSGVEPCEMNVLQELCSANPPPRLIPLPEVGKRAQIQSGLMAGATGVVLRSNRAVTVLAFSMPILAGAYKITIPTHQLLDLGPLVPLGAPAPPGSQSPPHASKKTHRAGRRAKRSVSKRPSSLPSSLPSSHPASLSSPIPSTAPAPHRASRPPSND